MKMWHLNISSATFSTQSVYLSGSTEHGLQIIVHNNMGPLHLPK